MLCGCLLLSAGLVLAQPAAEAPATPALDTILRQWDFDTSVEGWITPDPRGVVSLTKSAEDAYRGEGSLEFTYTQRVPKLQGDVEIPGAVLYEIAAPPIGLQSVRFVGAVAYSGPLAVVLAESDESVYMAYVWLEAGDWWECELGLSDFHLMSMMGEGPQAKDENGKLDPEQISAIGFADAGMFGRIMALMGAPLSVPDERESQIWLDDLVLSSEELEGAEAASPTSPVTILDGARKTLLCMPLGGEDTKVTAQEAAEGGDPAHMAIEYVVPAGKVFVVMLPLAQGALAGCKQLEVVVRADMAAQLAVALEEANGGRYAAMVTVPAGEKWTKMVLPISDLKAEPTTRDPNGTLDLEKVHQLAVVDIVPMFTQTMSANTWHIARIAATK